MNIMEAILMLDNLVDESDPDVSRSGWVTHVGIPAAATADFKTQWSVKFIT